MGVSASGVVAGVVLVLVAGCGGGGGSSASGASPSANAEKGRPPQQVVADAKGALLSAKAVHVTGTVSQQGQSEQLDVRFQGDDATGTVTVGGQAAQLVRTGGKLYLKASASFWSRTAGAAGNALGDKWLVVDGDQATSGSLTLQSLAASLDATGSQLTPQTTTATVDGASAVVVSQQDGSTLAVAATGTPYPLRIINKDAQAAGQISFSDYGKTVGITAPQGAVTLQQATGAAPGGA